MGAASRKHIRDNQLYQLRSVIQTGRKKGMHSMDDSLIKLYEAGEITYDVAINNSQDPVEMRDKIHKNNLDVM
jgi:twitching motility protein PilT